MVLNLFIYCGLIKSGYNVGVVLLLSWSESSSYNVYFQEWYPLLLIDLSQINNVENIVMM